MRGVISCLRRQDVSGQLEVVLVTPVGGLQDLDSKAMRGFAAVRRVELASISNLTAARAAGVRAATAPLVFIGETHSFVQPGCAETLIRTHAGPWAAVVPQVANAGRRDGVSWGSYLLDYARWGPGRPRGETLHPLVYNASYKRDFLLGMGDRLEFALNPHSEIVAHSLAASGMKACYEPTARIRHLSPGRPTPCLKEKFMIGLMIGGDRAARWSLFRRLLYFLGSPLIPAVLVLREFPVVLRFHRRNPLPWGTVPFMLLASTAKAAGEMFAYLAGTPAWVEAAESEIEVHRLRLSLPTRP